MTGSMWNSYGELELLDGLRVYSYVGVNRDTYDRVVKMCSRGMRGGVYAELSRFSKDK